MVRVGKDLSSSVLRCQLQQAKAFSEENRAHTAWYSARIHSQHPLSSGFWTSEPKGASPPLCSIAIDDLISSSIYPVCIWASIHNFRRYCLRKQEKAPQFFLNYQESDFCENILHAVLFYLVITVSLMWISWSTPKI